MAWAIGLGHGLPHVLSTPAFELVDKKKFYDPLCFVRVTFSFCFSHSKELNVTSPWLSFNFNVTYGLHLEILLDILQHVSGLILSYSSTEFIRFNANIAFFKYVQVDSFTANRLGWHFWFPFSFPTFSSLYMPTRRLVPLNTNEDCILLWGVWAVTTFESTFLGSGVGLN